VLQTAEGLTAIILRLGGAGGGLRARLSPSRQPHEEKERRERIAREWANWCRVRGHPRWCTCVYGRRRE